MLAQVPGAGGIRAVIEAVQSGVRDNVSLSWVAHAVVKQADAEPPCTSARARQAAKQLGVQGLGKVPGVGGSIQVEET